MIHRILTLSLFIAASQVFAQKKITLPDLNMEYDAPDTWETKSFFKSDWETPGGSDVCPCAVAVSSFKIPGKGVADYLYVIIYPSDEKKVNTEKRQNLWRYTFVPVTKTEKVKTKFMIWDQKISMLKPIGTYESQFKGYAAYRLAGTSASGPTHYLLYIIGKPAMLKEHKKEVDLIVQSFKPLK
jgi:hypothetical protein